MEAKLQRKIITWLKEQGCYVIKPRSGPGVPTSCPDVIVIYKDKWMVIEVKRSPDAPFQTGQKATLQHLRKWSTHVYVAYPENWAMIKEEIVAQFL